MVEADMCTRFHTVNTAAEFGKVAVLYGGSSAERAVSIMSGKAVHKGLLEKGVNAHLLDYVDVQPQQLIEQEFDRVWVALHGRGGEDGSLQGALQQLGMPYTGSGVLGSALGMDKIRSKMIFAAAGLKTPKWKALYINNDYSESEILSELGLPVVVKPALEGSSIGMTIVSKSSDLQPAIEHAFESDTSVLVEQFIAGREITGGVLQHEALPLIHIEAAGFYDYEAKYFSEETRYHCPSGLNSSLECKLREISLLAFNAVGASGWGRTDLMLDDEDEAWVLEVNTVPGMTSHSLVPMAAKQAGYSFSELVWKILETSFAVERGQA